MTSLLLTIIIAFVIVMIAIAFLAIGWLATGKSKIRPGACGRDPTKQKEEDCGKNSSCGLCEKPKDKKE